MSSIPTSQTTVLISGAGPAGLTLACELQRRGVPFRLIDRAPAPATTSRALTIQSPTLDLFERLGIGDEIVAQGAAARGAEVYDGDKRVLHLRLDPETSRNPAVVLLPQNRLEDLLRAHLAALGGTVEYARELVYFREEADSVLAVVNDVREVGVMEEIHATWLAGCDGMNSDIRKTLGIDFAGDMDSVHVLFADVDVDWLRRHDEMYLWVHPSGFLAALPLPGGHRWRLIAQQQEAAPDAPPPGLDLMQRILEERTGEIQAALSNPTWLSRATLHRRLAAHYRRGRVFLAGDAAHGDSPVTGHSMNLGIQEAFNLAWKLALVGHGKAVPGLLDTYQEERRPLAEAVLQGTEAVAQLLTTRNPALRFVREEVRPHLVSLAVVGEDLGSTAHSRLNYRERSLSQSHEGALIATTLLADNQDEQASVLDWFDFRSAPQAGDWTPQVPCRRAPTGVATTLWAECRGPHWTLLLFDGRAPTAAGYARLAGIARRVTRLLGDVVQPYLIVPAATAPARLDWDGLILLDPDRVMHQRYGAEAESLYFIRPDGYIGFRSQPVAEDAFMAYLEKLFVLPAADSLLATAPPATLPDALPVPDARGARIRAPHHAARKRGRARRPHVKFVQRVS
jgi:2-polyprenyl-6-methoxyphenol hydroxylase-like FAD-dependent oxidoreductase